MTKNKYGRICHKMMGSTIYHLTIYNPGSIYYCGDLHGNFGMFTICNLIPNSIFIICGDFGVGFNTKKRVHKELRILNEECKKINSTVIAIRGNHDNPDYFSKMYMDKFSNVILVPDYTLLTIDKTNVLCIGGNVSIDRELRREGVSYWTNELIDYSEDKLNTLKQYTDKNNIDIDVVASHCTPLDCFPLTSFKGLQGDDPRLELDVHNEINKMKLIKEFLNFNYDLKLCVFGHYHVHQTVELKGLRYVSLGIRCLHEHKV